MWGEYKADWSIPGLVSLPVRARAISSPVSRRDHPLSDFNEAASSLMFDVNGKFVTIGDYTTSSSMKYTRLPVSRCGQHRVKTKEGEETPRPSLQKGPICITCPPG
jgi:hypothetical protein